MSANLTRRNDSRMHITSVLVSIAVSHVFVVHTTLPGTSPDAMRISLQFP
jgi:hypothetical protein